MIDANGNFMLVAGDYVALGAVFIATLLVLALAAALSDRRP